MKIVTLPPFAFWKSLPKLPMVDPEKYVGFKARQTVTRREQHIEMETQHVATFTWLIEQCKEVLLFDSIWDEHVQISEVVDYDLPPGDINRVIWTAKKHTCFQVSMTGAELYGITDLGA